MSESAGVAITTVLSILVIVDIVGNSLVCLIIKRNRDMRIPINYLLVNLAVADIMYATFVAPKVFFELALISKHPGGVIGTVLCKFLTDGNFAWVGAVSSIVTMTAIAIERYCVVMHPHSKKGKLTKRKLKVMIPGVWIFSLVYIIPLFLVKIFDKKSNSCEHVWPEKWMAMVYTLIWNVIIVLPLALMVCLYSRVVYSLWFKRNEDNQLTHQQRGVMRVRKRVTLMVVTVSVIFGICWGTSTVVYILKHVVSYNIGPVPITIVNTMVLFNSAVNPFVYALLNRQFREKIKGMICCTGSMALRNHTMREHRDDQNIELADNTTQSSHTVGLSSTE